MALPIGTRLGPYLVEAPLGAGGMGEVYRARDTRLDRDVAIKVLPDLFASDSERLARFTREAKTLASLNHPNIAQVYGLEQSGQRMALVMELVEGEDLAQRIGNGPVPLDEALAIASQVADGLEAAHEQGIVHRDLKPANVRIRPGGGVKILDFGLAKAIETSGAIPALASSPTMTSPAMTVAGVILGTAAYMSPEQARGKAVDKRTDIWAFGCMLFEMLAGARPFDGDDVAETIGAVIHKEPAWDRLPAETPATVRTVLRSCLEKDPRKRLRDVGDVQLALAGAFESTASTPASAAAPASLATWRVAAVAAVAMALAGAITASGTRWAMRGEAPRVSRLALTTTGTAALTLIDTDRAVAISPDGSRIAYVGNNGSQLFVRPLDQLEPTAIADLGQPRGPFFSPQGDWIGFFHNNPNSNSLSKVAVNGGPAVRVVAKLDGQRRGGTWNEEGTVVFATANESSGLWSVSASGGDPVMLTKPNQQAGEGDHEFPEFLPGGRSVLFTITPASGSVDDARIAVLDLATRTYKVVVRGGFHAHYVPTGHLVYGTTGTLFAVPFVLDRLDTTGTPVPVLTGLATTRRASANVGIARNGTLVYVPEGASTRTQRTLVWVDRQGRDDPIEAPARGYLNGRISPDGSLVALNISDREDQSESDIWIWDLTRQALRRLTFDAARKNNLSWSADGGRVVFSMSRPGPETEFFSRSADGTGKPESLADPQSFPDGEISPDGRWLAYQSTATLPSSEVLVRPFPTDDGSRWQISTGGGRTPRWARSGRELFYLAQPSRDENVDALMVVSVEPGPKWSAGAPAKLFDRSIVSGTFDISSDGRRFLMIKSATPEGSAIPRGMIVVQNWLEELKAKVPPTR